MFTKAQLRTIYCNRLARMFKSKIQMLYRMLWMVDKHGLEKAFDAYKAKYPDYDKNDLEHTRENLNGDPVDFTHAKILAVRRFIRGVLWKIDRRSPRTFEHYGCCIGDVANHRNFAGYEHNLILLAEDVVRLTLEQADDDAQVKF